MSYNCEICGKETLDPRRYLIKGKEKIVCYHHWLTLVKGKKCEICAVCGGEGKGVWRDGVFVSAFDKSPEEVVVCPAGCRYGLV